MKSSLVRFAQAYLRKLLIVSCLCSTAMVVGTSCTDPSARLDAHHPLWKYGAYHWGEPEAGFDFKWADNCSPLQDAMFLQGDAAPNRRFNYRFVWER